VALGVVAASAEEAVRPDERLEVLAARLFGAVPAREVCVQSGQVVEGSHTLWWVAGRATVNRFGTVSVGTLRPILPTSG
jgi:hypothetical protein